MKVITKIAILIYIVFLFVSYSCNQIDKSQNSDSSILIDPTSHQLPSKEEELRLFHISDSLKNTPEYKAQHKADSIQSVKERAQHKADSIQSVKERAQHKADSIKEAKEKAQEEFQEKQNSIRRKPLMDRFNIDESEAQMVLEQEIWIGMPIKVVFYYRGGYNSRNVSNYGSGNNYQYCWHDYSPSCFYCGEDGIVKAYN